MSSDAKATQLEGLGKMDQLALFEEVAEEQTEVPAPEVEMISHHITGEFNYGYGEGGDEDEGVTVPIDLTINVPKGVPIEYGWHWTDSYFYRRVREIVAPDCEWYTLCGLECSRND